jgi:hypothetical protein
VQSDFRLPRSSTPSALKQCRRCGQAKPLAFFPRDRSRPDGRWHICKLCNQQHGRLMRQAASEQRRLALQTSPPPHQRLEALRASCNRNRATVFERLPRSLQQQAWSIYHKALRTHRQRYGFSASQPKRALLWACAVSNARRVGDNSWSRRMKRLKGWRRQRQRELMKWLQAQPSGCGNPARRRAGHSGVGYTPASRLAGI